MNCYFNAFKNYFNFSGRASRQEYFMFLLINTVICVALSLAFNAPEQLNYPLGIYGLLTLIPAVALGVRRLHDTNRTGWYLLVGAIPVLGFLILLFFKLQKGSTLPNRYGAALL
ncbi:DUF805 domain-containing protein [Aeromonas hydrophila]|uniref:DUF805 domain-containing protein n=1 Tax=Aeromonas hydrophila TaxID=644 RepID=UPI001C5BC194|nr:DUF805 domain-containing protein [Aeromonas hydrophila]MBW3831525.1 DUF805 domain-containing protein [Aeromonas hydrophila]MBW5266288.1 DUF805 domain-containing protein [Aeromonas hydrophila]MBW5279462.1 DUF805 domain-containing protein [Aeromonas hydrophila]